MDLHIAKAKTLKGEIYIPGDKSISHRSVMFGALANGITEIDNFLMGEDCLSTVRAFRAMGIAIEDLGNGRIRVAGKGLRGLQESQEVIDVGNSGTTMRLLLGILAGQTFFTALTGDESIRQRPMARVTKPLDQMGARIWGRKGGSLAPLAVQGTQLQGISYDSPVASAQVKSAVLLAGLYADGETSVTEPAKSRDHTERMLQAFGADLREAGLKVTMAPGKELTGQKVTVPGDISSAAFFLVAGAVVPDSELTLRNVGINPTRDGILEVLQAMGARISVENQRQINGEPVADLVVRGSELKGTVIEGDLIPRLIDEIPVLAVAAALAQGETIIRDAAELKVKETNRIATIIEELSKFGAVLEELEDGLRITGGKPLTGTTCQSHGDHRIAMAMAVAGLAAQGETIVKNATSAAVSYPGFAQVLKSILGE